MKKTIISIITCLTLNNLYAQTDALKISKDSLFIHEVENKKDPDKVLHAEPL